LSIDIWQVSSSLLKPLRAKVSRDARDAGIVMELLREYIEDEK